MPNSRTDDKDKVKIYFFDDASQFWILEGGTLTPQDVVQTKISRAGTYALGIEQTIVKDVTPPRMGSFTPPNGGMLKLGSTLSIQISDEGGTGLDLSSVKMRIDDKEVNALYDFETETLSYVLPESLTPGSYSVQVFAKDLAGNESRTQWIFTLSGSRSADFNGDGEIDHNDFFLFAAAFGQKATGANAKFDLDGDGEVGFGDFFIFAAAFGTAVSK